MSYTIQKKINFNNKYRLTFQLFHNSYRDALEIAVHFTNWNKRLFYPEVNKRNLFKLGYIATKSGHSRGSSVDLTIVHIATDTELDMGSPFDFFGPESWVDYSGISSEQKNNRQILQHIMNKYGFRSYPKEWWHFTLRNEPFPETYFNFPIE
mgnify:CR=1 FL=1